jgi:hypothetical protein
MKATRALLAGIACTPLLVPVLSGCGADALAESATVQPQIASGGSALHIERDPHLASHPAAFGATHVNSEPLAGLVLFFAMRARQNMHSEHLATTSPPCGAQRPAGVAGEAQRPLTHRPEGTCSDAY